MLIYIGSDLGLIYNLDDGGLSLNKPSRVQTRHVEIRESCILSNLHFLVRPELAHLLIHILDLENMLALASAFEELFGKYLSPSRDIEVCGCTNPVYSSSLSWEDY